MEAIAVQLRMAHLFEDPLTKLSVPIAAGTPASAGALARPVARLCDVCGGPLGDVDPLMNQQVHVSGPCNTNSYCLRCWADVFRDVGESLLAFVHAWFCTGCVSVASSRRVLEVLSRRQARLMHSQRLFFRSVEGYLANCWLAVRGVSFVVLSDRVVAMLLIKFVE
jgi:hypothetical protein